MLKRRLYGNKGWLQTERNFEFLSIIWETIKSAASKTGGNFGEYKIGRAA
jgi:hypothetical protein